jgi:ribonuclease HI
MEEKTAVGIVRMGAGKFVERRGLRLQDGYPTHMAELYALGSAIKSVAGRRGMDINFATDSRVALEMLTKRRGGTAHAIRKELKRIEDEGSTVKLWWSSDQHRGIAEADKIAKRAREKPEESPEERAPITGRMLKKEATKASIARWQTEWDTRHHRDSGHKASRLEPQSDLSPDGSRPVQRVPLAVPPV